MKSWKKPVIIEFSAQQLSKYIKAAAMSGICNFADFR